VYIFSQRWATQAICLSAELGRWRTYVTRVLNDVRRHVTLIQKQAGRRFCNVSKCSSWRPVWNRRVVELAASVTRRTLSWHHYDRFCKGHYTLTTKSKRRSTFGRHSINHFQQSRPSWTCWLWRLCRPRHGRESRTSMRQSTFDKPAIKSESTLSPICRRFVDCRLCRHCVPRSTQRNAPARRRHFSTCAKIQHGSTLCLKNRTATTVAVQPDRYDCSGPVFWYTLYCLQNAGGKSLPAVSSCVTTFLTTFFVERKTLALRCGALRPVYSDTTQLNSTRRRVELSCVAINGPLGPIHTGDKINEDRLVEVNLLTVA